MISNILYGPNQGLELLRNAPVFMSVTIAAVMVVLSIGLKLMVKSDSHYRCYLPISGMWLVAAVLFATIPWFQECSRAFLIVFGCITALTMFMMETPSSDASQRKLTQPAVLRS